MIWGWNKPRPERDAALTNRLLEAANALIAVAPDRVSSADKLVAALLVGDYGDARHLLEALPVSAPQVEALRALLPAKSFPRWKEFARLYRAMIGKPSRDPFRAMEELARLLDGIDHQNIPPALRSRHLELAKKASHLARARAIARRGAALPRPVQQFNDCWLRVLYATPVLAPLFQGKSYDDFLAEAAAEFPERDLRRAGLGFQQFHAWLAARGFHAEARVPNEQELAVLLAEKGPLFAAIAWFDRDVSALRSTQAVRHFGQHAVLITAAAGPAGRRLFTVDDPLLDHETRYLMTEFDLLQLIVYIVAPAA